MKKILLSLGVALITSSFSFSQEMNIKNYYEYPQKISTLQEPENGLVKVEMNRTAPGNNSVTAAGDTVYLETFPSLGAWTPSGTNQWWKYAAPTYKNGGCFSSPNTVRVNSQTKANGTLIYDADSANKVTNDPGGVCDGVAFKALNGSIISPSINLTGKLSVNLKFVQKYRLCCSASTDSLLVCVSGDGGTTWTNYDATHGNLVINSYPLTNPDTVNINISAVAANKSNVKIKFTFKSAKGVYFWELDDVAITENYLNDLKLTESTVDFRSGALSYFTKLPVHQSVKDTMYFWGTGINNGGNPQTNVKMHVTVTGGAPYNDSSATVASLAPLAIDTFGLVPITGAYTMPNYVANTKGTYSVLFNATQNEVDQNPSDNMATKIFAVTDTVYAIDDDVIAGYYAGPSNYVGGTENEAAMGTWFDIWQADSAMSVSFYLDVNTGVGASLEAGVYAYPASGTVPITPFIKSDLYDVNSAADVGKWVTLPLYIGGSRKLFKDSVYIVGVKNYQEGTAGSEMFISTDRATDQSMFASWGKWKNASNVEGWGYLGSAHPRIRLNTYNYPVGINELSANGIKVDQNFPNPFNGKTKINYEVNKFSKVSLEVYDIAGHLVYSQNEGGVSAGKHSIILNTRLAAGAYSYTLRANETSLTKQMIVTQ